MTLLYSTRTYGSPCTGCTSLFIQMLAIFTTTFTWSVSECLRFLFMRVGTHTNKSHDDPAVILVFLRISTLSFKFHFVSNERNFLATSQFWQKIKIFKTKPKISVFPLIFPSFSKQTSWDCWVFSHSFVLSAVVSWYIWDVHEKSKSFLWKNCSSIWRNYSEKSWSPDKYIHPKQWLR